MVPCWVESFSIGELGVVSAYTKLIVYFIMRLIGRLKPGLHKQSLPSETEEIKPAIAGLVCVDAVLTARSN